MITAAQQGELRNNGYVSIRGLVKTAEVAYFRPLIGESMRRQRPERRREMDRVASNLWRLDEGIRRLVLARRLGKVAADLLGVSNVRIYHDEALFKEPGAGGSPWRRDGYFQPLDGSGTITVWMPMVDLSVDMGMLAIAAGSHKHGMSYDPRVADGAEPGYRKYIREQQLPVTQQAAMRAGDSVWFYGDTVHSAGANRTDRTREVMSVIYMAEGTRVRQPVNAAQTAGWNAWLMGLPPGRLAASELNPLVL